MRFTVTQGESDNKGGCGAVIAGIALIFGCCYLLYWNEIRAHNRKTDLDEGRRNFVSVSADSVDDSHQGELVHLKGTADTDEVLGDPVFEVESNALKLRRVVEMYQWSETEHHNDDGPTTYSYSRGWEDRLINSDAFHEPSGHENPDAMRIAGREFDDLTLVADEIRLGAFRLTGPLVRQLNDFDPRSVQPEEYQRVNSDLRSSTELINGRLHTGDPAEPEVGDVRVLFRRAPPSEVTVLAAQKEDRLEPWPTSEGRTLAELRYGLMSGERLIRLEKRDNIRKMWIYRGLGTLGIFFGFTFVLSPLKLLLGWVPYLGELAGRALNMVAFGLALPVAGVAVIVGWSAARPLKAALAGAALFLGVGLVLYWIRSTEPEGQEEWRKEMEEKERQYVAERKSKRES